MTATWRGIHAELSRAFAAGQGTEVLRVMDVVSDHVGAAIGPGEPPEAVSPQVTQWVAAALRELGLAEAAAQGERRG